MCDRLAVMYAGRVVEIGAVTQIFNAPRHPYTAALIASIPRMTDSQARLAAIEGQPPDLAALPPGCAFAPRCAQRLEACTLEAPPPSRLADGRVVRCWAAMPRDRREAG
jgi:oligopeptide/dipeptide ABC transporter ATP-binding protein